MSIFENFVHDIIIAVGEIIDYGENLEMYMLLLKSCLKWRSFMPNEDWRTKNLFGKTRFLSILDK